MGISKSGCNFKLPKNAKKLNDDIPENSRIADLCYWCFPHNLQV
jgi:hypothetical protein